MTYVHHRSPKARALLARSAALTRWALTPEVERKAASAKARAGLDAKFAAQVDPDGTMDPQERARRVQMLRSAHFSRMAAESVETRARKAARKTNKKLATTGEVTASKGAEAP